MTTSVLESIVPKHLFKQQLYQPNIEELFFLTSTVGIK